MAPPFVPRMTMACFSAASPSMMRTRRRYRHFGFGAGRTLDGRTAASTAFVRGNSPRPWRRYSCAAEHASGPPSLVQWSAQASPIAHTSADAHERQVRSSAIQSDVARAVDGNSGFATDSAVPLRVPRTLRGP